MAVSKLLIFLFLLQSSHFHQEKTKRTKKWTIKKKQQSVKISMFRLKFPLFKALFSLSENRIIYHLFLSFYQLLCVFFFVYMRCFYWAGKNRSLFMTMRNCPDFFSLSSIAVSFAPALFCSSFPSSNLWLASSIFLFELSFCVAKCELVKQTRKQLKKKYPIYISNAREYSSNSQQKR